MSEAVLTLPDLHEIEDWADGMREKLSKQAERAGFEHLAEIALYSSDPDEMMDAAALDLVALGVPEQVAYSAVTVGILTGSLMRTVKQAAETILAPDVEPGQ